MVWVFPVSACKKQTFETEDADILDMGMDAPNGAMPSVLLTFCFFHRL